MENNQQQNEELQTISLKNLHQKIGLSGISLLRENTSNYAFLTLIRSDKSAANFYFSKELGALIKTNFEIGQRLPDEFLMNLAIVKTTNDKGESRMKLYSMEKGNYTSTSNLFGISEKENDLIQEIKSEFKTSEQNVLKVTPVTETIS